jgi:hypothetical protein
MDPPPKGTMSAGLNVSLVPILNKLSRNHSLSLVTNNVNGHNLYLRVPDPGMSADR